MIGQTRNEQVYDNETDRDGNLVRSLYHTLFLAVKAGVKAAAGSIALGFRIFTATAERFGPPRV